MSSLDFDGERDIFFDLSDDIKSSTYSTARCSISDQLSASWRPEYELWTSEPMSVNERRHRFLVGMGLAQPVPIGIAFSQRQGEALADSTFRDLEERISSICSSYRASFSQCASAPDATYCIRDMETGNRILVCERECDGLTGRLEDGTDKIVSINQSEGFLSFSQLLHEIFRKGSGRSHVRGPNNAAATDKQKDPKSFCGGFRRKKGEERICVYGNNMESSKASTFSRTKVDLQNKNWMDFSGVYMCQEIQAHGGSIRIMKFSPSGWYLASVGEDCIVRIWMIREVESSPDLYGRPVEYMDRNKGLKMKVGKGWCRSLAVIPKKVFNIADTPLHEFHGHTSDILDMTWSKSDFLLTSSKDKTVRMWKIGCDGCLAVFKHRDYVTCIQFNPIDERYFVSGSIDGKVRVWDVSEKRVVDWADTRDIIAAVSYKPDGKGLIVGTVAGRCRFYDQSGENMELEKELKVKKKSAGSQITSLQFSRDDPARIVIASAGSKIRVSDDGAGISRKFEGRRGSKVLVPPSLTSDGQYLVSAGKDSNVYIWDFDKGKNKSTKATATTVRSCERFFSEGVTSVATWPGLLHQHQQGCGCSGGRCDCDLRWSSSSETEKGRPTVCRDRECCSFGAWFFTDGVRGAATWPEEKLLPSLKYVSCGGMDECRAKVSAAWNTVVVTGGRDGVIRCFHNYGLPVKL
ncbi:hypothetical protein U9M48_023204 [Paspalum notatum var. saurae]|uniref:Uncharacterized protein n=1 Tax=Paspalum notatum var. saurae TaxID=547442 RepID=A0AAQ3WUW5_PASNO